jgi:hypothetical protein
MANLSPYQQQALLGAWYSIVGQQSGVPSNMQHGGYGGHYRSAQPTHMRQPWPPQMSMGAEVPPMTMPPMPPPAMHPHHQHTHGGHYQIPPRNALIQDPGPQRAGREVLPMSTGVAILPTQSAQITARPQRVAFRPERVFISAAGTSGGAADWVVNDIKIGNRSQFSQSGDVPGDMFATNAIDGFVSFETAQTAMDVVMVVTYIGLNESGVPFFASIVGTAAI